MLQTTTALSIASATGVGTTTATSAQDINSSDTLWQFDIGEERRIETSPTIVDGIVYFGTLSGAYSGDGSLYALDGSDGSKLWSFVPGNSTNIRSTPTVVDNIVYVADDDGSVYALDAADGSIYWEFEKDRRFFFFANSC